MSRTGIAIKYGDIAPGAKEEFVPDANDKAGFVDLSQLQKYNLTFENYENPLEPYTVLLDGGAVPFPSNPNSKNLGLWSSMQSESNGAFSPNIQLTLTSEGFYTSQGITFTFDTYNNTYPKNIIISWYRDTGDALDIITTKNFQPDSAMYFCQNYVETFNKLIIYFCDLNVPNTRLKLRSIDYGYGTYFYGDELRNVSNIQEIDPISSEISVNTTDFTLDSKSTIEYSFQTRQPISVYFNDVLISTMFVKSAKRKARFLWDVQCEDYISLLENIPYHGDIYVDASAADIIKDIFTTAKVPYELDPVFNNSTVTGHIPYTNCREALMQVAFAIQAVVDTSYSDKVKIFALSDVVKQTVKLERIMRGQSFVDDENVTGIEITVHDYDIPEEEEKVNLYKAKESGYGDNILVVFSDPVYNLQILRGEIVESSANHAIINAEERCFLNGYKYEHTTSTVRKNRDLIKADEVEKVISINDATLVSQNNIDTVKEKCYNWLIKVKETDLDIIEAVHVKGNKYVRYGDEKYGTFQYYGKSEPKYEYDEVVKVGDNITAETEYLGDVTGRVIKQTFNLIGNTTIKKTVVK